MDYYGALILLVGVVLPMAFLLFLIFLLSRTSALRSAPRTGKLEAAFEDPCRRWCLGVPGLEPRPRRPGAIRRVEPF